MLNVAAIQFNPKFLDLEANREKIKDLINRAKDKYNSKLMVLPELAFSGYNFENIEQVKKTGEEIPSSDSCRLLEELSTKKGIYIISGINETAGNNYFNSAVVFGPHGYVTKYRKIQLYAREKEFFQPGDSEPNVFDLDRYKVGIMICFDWFFPEIPRTLALKGADVICHPMNAVIPDGAYLGDTYHSKWNRIFIILSNRIGKERDLQFIGRSIITNHKGNILKKASPNKEEIITATIDPKLSRNKQLNEFNDIIKDRRTNYYKLD
ncbi:MAG: acyltransferase [Candidatus Lokiarchaeota archaeon]|nr:acyltransferase [Candidatus Lokiarchaeota archaeon]